MRNDHPRIFVRSFANCNCMYHRHWNEQYNIVCTLYICSLQSLDNGRWCMPVVFIFFFFFIFAHYCYLFSIYWMVLYCNRVTTSTCHTIFAQVMIAQNIVQWKNEFFSIKLYLENDRETESKMLHLSQFVWQLWPTNHNILKGGRSDSFTL